jgi:hypothetical protein
LNGWAEFFAVSENNLAKIKVEGAAFDAMADQRDLVPRLDGIPIPSLPGQRIRTIRFPDPFLNLPTLVRDIEMDERMGIDPLEFRYDALQGDAVRHIVIRPAVVREHRPSNQEKTSGSDQHSQQLIFHLSTLCDFDPTRVQKHMPAALSCQSQIALAAGGWQERHGRQNRTPYGIVRNGRFPGEIE